MNSLIAKFSIKSALAVLVFTFLQVVAIAQEEITSKITKTTTSTSSTWYAEPWVWVVGAAVLILILVALLRGGGSSTTAGRTDQVTVTKTTSTDI